MSKPSQLPIYRAVENLMIWSIPFVERLPKSLPYQTLGGLLIRDIRECLDAVILTTQASASAKVGPLQILIARMTAVKTTMRVLKESKKITAQQEVQYLDMLNSISTQAGAWMRKVAMEANANSVNDDADKPKIG